MSFQHYFSNDPDKRARFIFNFIAPIYGYMGSSLELNFVESIEVVEKHISIGGKSVLDIGTGTGAWAANFKHRGAARIIGIDLAEKMLILAQKTYPTIEFTQGNAEDLSQFANDSFDIVTASFVLHGVKEYKRASLLKEMKRVSRKHIVIHDFVGKTPLFIRVLECLERSDYKSFKTNFCKELKTHFNITKRFPVNTGVGIYLAEK